MKNGFRTILVPVDFSINSEVAIKKAIELSERGTLIHLLNVQLNLGLWASSSKYFVEDASNSNDDMVDQKMDEWKWAIEASGSSLTVCTWISFDNSVHEGIEKKAGSLKPDLIIIGKNSHHCWLPFLNTVVSSKIAERTGVPVLTIKPGSWYSKIKKVIVPVTSQSLQHKKEIISTLCDKYNVQVHLVTFMDENKPSDFQASSLLEFYQWMTRSIQCSVEYTVLHGHNRAKEILNYADKIKADLLLVHPKTETRIGWLNRQISDVLPADSKLQVLAVQRTG